MRRYDVLLLISRRRLARAGRVMERVQASVAATGAANGLSGLRRAAVRPADHASIAAFIRAGPFSSTILLFSASVDVFMYRPQLRIEITVAASSQSWAAFMPRAFAREGVMFMDPVSGARRALSGRRRNGGRAVKPSGRDWFPLFVPR